MNNIELKKRVIVSSNGILHKNGYIVPVELLMALGVLQKKDYENWRLGKVAYLEKVCTANLHKISLIMHQLRSYAFEHNLRPSWTALYEMGQGNKNKVAF